MSLALVNKIHHLEQQVQYLVAETEKLREEVIGLKANRKVAALEMEIPSVRSIPDPGKQEGLKK